MWDLLPVDVALCWRRCGTLLAARRNFVTAKVAYVASENIVFRSVLCRQKSAEIYRRIDINQEKMGSNRKKMDKTLALLKNNS